MKTSSVSFKLNEVTVYKQDNSINWHYYYNLNKKRIRRSTGESDRLKAIEYIKDKVIPLIMFGRGCEIEKNITLEQAVKKYLEFTKPRVKAKTYRNEKLVNTKRFINDIGHQTRIGNITKSEMKHYFTGLTDRLASVTIHSYASSMRAFFSYFLDEEIIPNNPLQGITKHLPKKPKASQKYFEKEVLDNILKCAMDYDATLYRLFMIIRYTGMRIQEALSLKGSNFDIRNKLVKIKANKEIDFSPKSHQERDVPIPTILIDFVKEFIKENEWVIAKNDGSHWSEAPKKRLISFNKKFNIEYNKKNNEEDNINCTFHRFRHSYAENWLRQGKDIYQLSKILGHYSVSVTEMSYGNFNKKLVFLVFTRKHYICNKRTFSCF
jgi:integrase/recombinase XerD